MDKFNPPFKLYGHLSVYLLKNPIHIQGENVIYCGKRGKYSLFYNQYLAEQLEKKEMELKQLWTSSQDTLPKPLRFINISQDESYIVMDTNKDFIINERYNLQFIINGIWIKNQHFGCFIQNLETY